MKLTDKFEKCAGVYVLTNLINGKTYVGETLNVRARMRQHFSSEKQAIHLAIKKYGIDNFFVYVEYLKNFNKKTLQELEGQLIIKYNCLSPQGYNILSKGQDSTGYKHSDEVKLRMSELKKGKPLSDEHKRKMSEIGKGRKHSEETKLKMRNSQLGHKHSKETLLKMSNAKKGIAPSPLCQAKALEANKERFKRPQ